MSSPILVDPYETLGVSRDADLAAIRMAHRKLVLKHHPDRIKDPAEQEKGKELFQKAQQSYELLIDDSKRQRYDQKVKLAELRAAAMRDQPIRSASYPVRPMGGSNYEYRDGRIVEERAPKFDEDYFEEPRPTARKHEGYERERKSSATYAERDKRSKHPGISSSLKSKLSEKASHARERVHQEAAKSRDKERKRETSDKYSRKTAYVEEDDESSDSDTATYVSRRPMPRRAATYDDRSRRTKTASTPRKESKRSPKDDDYFDEYDYRGAKHEDYHTTAREYIERSSTRPKVFQDDTRSYWTQKSASKTSGRKSGSDKEGRKSGSDPDDRRQERPKPSQSRRPSVDIVEPRIVPSMPKQTSAPSNLRGAPTPQRASTAQFAKDHRREPMLPRSLTTPLTGMTSRKNDTMPSKGSKLKHTETQDSGYSSSSPATPEHHGTSPPKHTSTKYQIVDEPEDLARGHRTVLVDPEENYRRARSHSRERERDRDRERPSRPAVSARSKTSKASSYSTHSPETARPIPIRHGSSRPSTSHGEAKLFGERGFRSVYPDEKIRYSDKITPENVNYSSYGGGRRASADHYQQDSYFNERPKLSRKETVYA